MQPDDLATAVSSAPLASIDEATFFRSVSLRVVQQLGIDILDGAHAGRTGGRYNPPGSLPTCYFARSQTLSCLESEHDRLVLALDPKPAAPRLVVSVVVRNLAVLDLTNPLVRDHLRLQLADLTKPTLSWRQSNARGGLALPQLLGDAARSRADIDGLLVPSWFQALAQVIPNVENLVVFMDPASPGKPRNAGVHLEVRANQGENPVRGGPTPVPLSAY